MGVPFIHMGRDIKTGLDCYGLVKDAYKVFFGIDIIDVESYARKWFLKGEDYFGQNAARQFEAVEKPRPGDVVLFNASHGTANHTGIVLSAGWFLHASHAGVVRARLAQRYWRDRIVGFYRLKGAA